LDRAIKRLHNKHLQPEERWGAVQAVLSDPSDAALDAALKRFSIYVDPSTVDNEEKEYIADSLAARGEEIVPRLRVALGEQESITWLVRIAGRVLAREGLHDLLLEIVRGFDTEYERNPERKIQVVMALADFPGEATAAAIAPFLDDVNETVRFQAVATAFEADVEGPVVEGLVRILLEDESVRVRNAVLEGLADKEWSLKGHRGAVEEKLPKGYAIDRNGTVKRRPKG
jgi:HEAT repeat protein